MRRRDVAYRDARPLPSLGKKAVIQSFNSCSRRAVENIVVNGPGGYINANGFQFVFSILVENNWSCYLPNAAWQVSTRVLDARSRTRNLESIRAFIQMSQFVFSTCGPRTPGLRWCCCTRRFNSCSRHAVENASSGNHQNHYVAYRFQFEFLNTQLRTLVERLSGHFRSCFNSCSQHAAENISGRG